MAPNDPHTQAMTMAGLNLIQQALSIYDSDLRLVVSNAPFRDLFDLPTRLVTPGSDFAETIRYLVEKGEYGEVDDVDAAVQARVDQARAFEPHYMERTRANGRTISVEGSPLPQGGWVTVYTDITQTTRQEALLRARSEELSEQVIAHTEQLSATNRQLGATNKALEEAKRQLTETEARTRHTTEMMPAHITHVDTDLRYTFSNKRLASVMPGRPPDIVGQFFPEVMGRETYRNIEPHMIKALAGQASVFEFNDELSSRRIRGAFTPDTDGDKVNGVYILSMDITEEAQTRAALQQTKRREIAAQVSSGLAHDFSNLLTIILGTQSRLQRMELTEDAKQLISATVTAANRGGVLLNRIADITTPRHAQLRATDLAEFLEQFTILASAALPDAVTLEVNNNVRTPNLMLDRGLLQDSLLNLILNARDACGTSGKIVLKCETVKDTWVDFSVTDTGAGFSEEALTHALEPFFTTKGSEGSGLGLSMVYDMAKLSGGRVRLANLDSGGSVSIRLPLRAAQRLPASGMVLLVEDNPDLRVNFRDMLTELGHSVIETSSADEALVLLNELPDISLILSDISLEGSATGIDLVQQAPSGKLGKFLMTSLPPDHPLFKAASATAPLLRKPFTKEELTRFLYPEPQP